MQRLARLVVAVVVLASSSAASVRSEDSLLFTNENRFYRPDRRRVVGHADL